MSKTYAHPLLGIQFKHPKKYQILTTRDVKNPIHTYISFFDTTSINPSTPSSSFGIEYRINDKNFSLQEFVNHHIAVVKKMTSQMPFPIPPTLNVNFMNSTKYGELNAIIFELEILPMNRKTWSVVVAEQNCQIFVIGSFSYSTPPTTTNTPAQVPTTNSKPAPIPTVPTNELSTFQKIMESFVFIPPTGYGQLIIYKPDDGLIIPSNTSYMYSSNPSDGNLIFDAKGSFEEIFCYSFNDFKNLDEFVESRKKRWAQISKFKEEKVSLNFEAIILEFEDRNSGFNFVEMCFMRNGISYLINASKTQQSQEQFLIWLMSITFDITGDFKTTRKNCLKYLGGYRLPFQIDFPIDGIILEEINTNCIIVYADSKEKSMTKVLIKEEKNGTSHYEALNQLSDTVIKGNGTITHQEVVNIKIPGHGLTTMFHLDYCLNNHISRVTGSICGEKLILVESVTKMNDYFSFKPMIDDIHQSFKIGKLGTVDYNFRSNLLDCHDFGDVIIKGMIDTVDTFCFHIGMRFIHSPTWDITVDQFCPPPTVQYFIMKKQHFGTLSVELLQSKQKVGQFADVCLYGKTVIKRESKILHKYDCEEVVVEGEFGKEWYCFIVNEYYGYSFSYTDEIFLDEFKNLVYHTKFIDPMNNGRTVYQNSEFGLSFLFPSFDFTAKIVNSRDTVLHANIDELEGFEVKLIKHEEISNINDLIKNRKNYFSQIFRDFTDRKPERTDQLDGHCFIAFEEGETKELQTFEYCFIRNGVGLSLSYGGWKEQFELESPELYLLELKFDDEKKIKTDALRYECFLYNFTMLLPIKCRITEFLHADSQIHQSEVVSFEMEDNSLTFVTKEPYQFKGFEKLYEETKMYIFSLGATITSIKLQKLKNQPVSIQAVYHSAYFPQAQKKFSGVITKFKFNNASTLTFDTNVDEGLLKDEDLKNWIEMHESYQEMVSVSLFDHHVQEYSLKIEFPTNFYDTEFVFSK
eukprot:gene7404-11727_t